MKILKGKKREQMQSNITTDIVSTLEKTKKSSEEKSQLFLTFSFKISLRIQLSLLKTNVPHARAISSCSSSLKKKEF